MSTRLERGGGGGRGGGRGGREFFLSTHRCPEVDLLPHHDSRTQMPLSSELTCTGQSEANYLDISTCRTEEEEDEEEEGSISDWSEEDLSLHFSPSVILPSDEEESDPESGFECVDVTMETRVRDQEGEGLKMVPKRLIQLKKKKDGENISDQENTDKLQVILKDGPAEGEGTHSEVSANELLCPTVRHCPNLLLRQHSMPASLHTCSTTSSDVDSYRVYRGLVAGASQGFHTGDIRGNSAPRQRLQKSFSLDETKTKMASCIIKSVLSKKMQVEQNNSKTSYLQKNPALLPGFPPPAGWQRGREGGGGESSCKIGGGVSKAPAHVVRDMRSLVKNTYSLSFSTAPTATPENNIPPTSFRVIGRQDSPPPTYQQAVGVKGHSETKTSCPASAYSSRGHVAKVAASLSQSQDREPSDRFSRPITQQRRGSEPIISRGAADDVTWPVVLLDPPTDPPVSSDQSELSQSERSGGVGHQAGTPPTSVFIEPPPRHPQGTQPALSAQEQSPTLGVSSQSAPSSSQQILHSCFYTPIALPAFPPTLHLGKVSYLHSPLSYIQTQLQPPPPVPILHLLRTSEENQSAANPSDHQDRLPRTETPSAQEQQTLQQQHFLCGLQGFLPAQVGRNLLVDITGSAAAPGALLNVPAPCHMMLEPKSGQCLYVEPPQPPQRKMLLDPETGQYVQVFLPAAGSAPNTGVFPVRCANSTPTVIKPTPTTINPAPAILSVRQIQPTVAVSALYAPPCLPFTLHTPPVTFTHTQHREDVTSSTSCLQ